MIPVFVTKAQIRLGMGRPVVQFTDQGGPTHRAGGHLVSPLVFLSTLLSPSASQGESGATRIPASISSPPFRLQRPVRRWRRRGDGGSMSGVHIFS